MTLVYVQQTVKALLWKVGMHRFEPVRTGSNGFKKILTCANQGPNHAFGSGLTLDFEPNFGPVRKSSGSNLGSEPDCGSTRRMVFLTSQSFILTPFSVQLTLSQYMIQNPYPHWSNFIIVLTPLLNSTSTNTLIITPLKLHFNLSQKLSSTKSHFFYSSQLISLFRLKPTNFNLSSLNISTNFAIPTKIN